MIGPGAPSLLSSAPPVGPTLGELDEPGDTGAGFINPLPDL